MVTVLWYIPRSSLSTQESSITIDVHDPLPLVRFDINAWCTSYYTSEAAHDVNATERAYGSLQSHVNTLAVAYVYIDGRDVGIWVFFLQRLKISCGMLEADIPQCQTCQAMI